MNERYSIPNPCRRAVLAAVLMTLISPLIAQERRLILAAQDPAGAVIPGVTVELLDRNDKVVRRVRTNDRGEALWADLGTGDWGFRLKDTSPKR